jgi:biopolymer transport protein ExbB
LDSEYSLLSLFADGGGMMYPLVLCSLIGMGVILAKGYTLWAAARHSEKILKAVPELVQEGKMDEAMHLCATTPGPSAAILLAGLRRISRGEVQEAELERAIDTTGTI